MHCACFYSCFLLNINKELYSAPTTYVNYKYIILRSSSTQVSGLVNGGSSGSQEPLKFSKGIKKPLDFSKGIKKPFDFSKGIKKKLDFSMGMKKTRIFSKSF